MLINVFIIIRSINTYIAGINASRNIFEKIWKSLLNGSIPLFYDTNPMGRILNRLSKDQNIIDSILPGTINTMFSNSFTILMFIYFCVWTVPAVIIIVFPVFFVSLKIQKFYLNSSREITRLEMISKSPIVQHFSETIQGLTTIKAFGYQNGFIRTYNNLIDKSVSLSFYKNGCSCWLSIVLELVSDVILLFCTLTIVLTKDSIDPGLAGTCLVYIMLLPDEIYNAISVSTNLENYMVSVERIHNMSNIEQEDLRIKKIDESLIQQN